MTIERIVNGTIYEFPDGTPESVVNRFVTQRSGSSTGAAFVPPSQGRRGATGAYPTPDRPQALLPGAAGHALQGLSMGFSDEAIARARASMDPGPRNYEDYVKAEREGLRKYGEEHPVLSTGSEIGGALLPAAFSGGASLIPAVTKTAAAKLGPRLAGMLFGNAPSVGRMAGYGAASGATTAVGTSELPASEWGAEALRGGAAGAATATGAGLVGKYIAAPAFSRIKSALGYGDSNKMADAAIAKALAKDGLSPEEAAFRMNAVTRGEMTLADLGENTAALLRRSTVQPGDTRSAAKSALAQRESERVPRVSDDLRTLMSASKDFYTDVQDLVRKRSEDARTLYDAAYATAPAFSPKTAPDIERLRNLPSFRKAMEGGAKRMQDEGLDISDPRNTLRALHETKLQLDDMIDTAMRGGEKNQAKTLISMKERLLKDMEAASPEYRTARQTFAGDSEMLTAMEEGRKIYGMPELEMRKLADRFKDSPSEYDAFRAGISQAMLERLRAGGGAGDPIKTVFPKDSEDKLRRVFRDDSAFDEFKNRLTQERTMLETEKTGFRKTPVDMDLEGPAGGVGAAANLLAGHPVAAALEAARTQFPNVLGMPPRVAAPVAQKLLTPAAKTDSVLDSIMSSLKEQEQSLTRASAATNGGAALAGGLGAARGIKAQYPEDEGAPPAAAPASPLQLGAQ